MALATGVAVANIYYNQPMLGIIHRAFPGSAIPGLIPTATQIGYAAGILLLLPLGDLMDRRRLIVGQFLVLALALVLAAWAPTAAGLLAASVVVGVGSAVAQQIVPFAASLAAPESRGRAIGAVMSGLLCGILLSRTLAGFVAAQWGWREMFGLSVPLALSTAVLMAMALPRGQPSARVGYAEALRSLAHLWRHEPRLRIATLAQAGLFASFSVFWTILALHLEGPPFHRGPDVAGLFGILGAAGVFAAPLAGRIADRRGPQLTIWIGAAAVLASWAIFGLIDTLGGLVIGVVLLDFGVQSALVSHQHVIYALRPEARSRLNTVFVTGMFLGGAIGSAVAIVAWRLGGWSAVTLWGAATAIFVIALRWINRL
ncbi:MAG: MFS transporter [Steroidobacteraceae bacterium]|jgi:predicted MFS family arabinose efflux permease